MQRTNLGGVLHDKNILRRAIPPCLRRHPGYLAQGKILPWLQTAADRLSLQMHDHAFRASAEACHAHLASVACIRRSPAARRFLSHLWNMKGVPAGLTDWSDPSSTPSLPLSRVWSRDFLPLNIAFICAVGGDLQKLSLLYINQVQSTVSCSGINMHNWRLSMLLRS